MAQFGAAVIGLGVGRGHVAGYQADSRVRVKAICDVDARRLKGAEDEFGIEITYDDWRWLLERDDIHIVSVCTPDWLHAEQAIALMEAGKHVVVEKPMVTTLEDARRMVRTVERTGRKLMVNHILRFCPRFQEVKRLAERGIFGGIFYAEGDYIHNCERIIRHGWRGERGRDYNIVLGGGTHLIDVLRWVIGDEVMEVSSFGNRFGFKEEEFEGEDCVVSILKFRNGCVAKTLTTIACRRPMLHNLQIYGTQATFINTYDTGKIYVGERAEDVIEMRQPYPGIPKGVALTHFIDCIERDTMPLMNVRESARTAAVCIAAREAARTGRVVGVEQF